MGWASEKIFFAQLKDEDEGVRLNALIRLRCTGYYGQPQYLAPAVAAMLRKETSPQVIEEALSILQACDRAVQNRHVRAVVALLQNDNDDRVRACALETLQEFETAVQLRHVRAVVALLQYDDGDVRETALKTLRRLEERTRPWRGKQGTVLTRFAGAIAETLRRECSHSSPRWTASAPVTQSVGFHEASLGAAVQALELLALMEPSRLAQHASAIFDAMNARHDGRFSEWVNGDMRVHESAVQTLERLPFEVLNQQVCVSM